ncbi:MAG: SGNH/GDSL hydrolase family protein [Chloroflexota bacterium]
MPVEHFIIMPPEVRANVQTIFARGQELGRNPHAFSKVGDSISLTSHYFARFDQHRYNLGLYERLQPTIDFYDGSFERFGLAVRIGLHAWIAFRPGLADPDQCEPGEHMVECEFRRHNPSVLLIRLGTNDTAEGDAYEKAIRFAIKYSIDNGVIPVLVTKSDRFEGDDRHNVTLRALAAEYAVPLWDFDVVAGTLPDRGLSGDTVHLTMYGVNDFTDPATLSFGYPLSDLTGLMMLDAIRQTIEGKVEE